MLAKAKKQEHLGTFFIFFALYKKKFGQAKNNLGQAKIIGIACPNRASAKQPYVPALKTHSPLLCLIC